MELLRAILSSSDERIDAMAFCSDQGGILILRLLISK